jgi:CrcB protein
LVFIGSGLGGAARHGVNVACLRAFGPGFPVATLAVNVAGSFAMGLVAGVLALKTGASAEMRLFLATGILGGFTTFSAFSLDAVTLWQRGEAAAAGAYVMASVALSIAGLVAGLVAAKVIA